MTTLSFHVFDPPLPHILILHHSYPIPCRSDYGFFRVRYQLFLVSQRVGRAAFQDAGGELCGFEVVDEGEVCVFA